MSTRTRKIDFQISMAWNIVIRFSVITVLSNHLLDSGLCLSVNVWQGFQLGTASARDVSSLHLFSVMEDCCKRRKHLIQI